MGLLNHRPRPTRHAVCYFTVIMEGDKVEAAKMSPSSDWLGLLVFRLGIDDLLAAAPAHPADEADAGSARGLSAAPLDGLPYHHKALSFGEGGSRDAVHHSANLE